MPKTSRRKAANPRRTTRATTPARRPSPPEFKADEYVRIVPLHTEKPSLPLKDLVRGEAGDPFDGAPLLATPGPKLSYRGGALLQNVEVFTIFWGKQWAAAASAQALMAKINQFFSDILGSALIDQLAEYSVAGKKIGHGKLVGSKVITAKAPSGSISDSQIKTQLVQWIAGNVVPKNNKNSLYFVYLDPGVVSILGGSKSCQNYCGYHNNTGARYYAVMPFPSCTGCLGGLTPIDALTGTSSHELCEAITDPVPGQGWYDNSNGEIGDICAWHFKQVGNWNVQLEWSNANGKCM
jgi:hypothetical protein